MLKLNESRNATGHGVRTRIPKQTSYTYAPPSLTSSTTPIHINRCATFPTDKTSILKNSLKFLRESGTTPRRVRLSAAVRFKTYDSKIRLEDIATNQTNRDIDRAVRTIQRLMRRVIYGETRARLLQVMLHECRAVKESLAFDELMLPGKAKHLLNQFHGYVHPVIRKDQNLRPPLVALRSAISADNLQHVYSGLFDQFEMPCRRCKTVAMNPITMEAYYHACSDIFTMECLACKYGTYKHRRACRSTVCLVQ